MSAPDDTAASAASIFATAANARPGIEGDPQPAARPPAAFQVDAGHTEPGPATSVDTTAAPSTAPDIAQLMQTVQAQGAQIAQLLNARQAPTLPEPPPVANAAEQSAIAGALQAKRTELSACRYALQVGNPDQRAQAERVIPGLERDIGIFEHQQAMGERLAALESAPQKTQAEQAARDWVSQRLSPEVLEAAQYPRLASLMRAGHVDAEAVLTNLDLAGFDVARPGETIAHIDRQLRLIELGGTAPVPAPAPSSTTAGAINPGAIAVPRNGTASTSAPQEPQFQDGDWKQRLLNRMQRQNQPN